MQTYIYKLYIKTRFSEEKVGQLEIKASSQQNADVLFGKISKLPFCNHVKKETK